MRSRWACLSGDGASLHAEAFMPRGGGFERGVDVLNIANAFILQPIFKGLGALLGVDGDAVLPGGAAAEDAVEGGAGLARQLQGFDEDGVGDAGRKIDERLAGWLPPRRGKAAGLRSGVGGSPLKALVPATNSIWMGTSTLRTSTPIFVIGEIRMAPGHDFRLLLGVLEGLFVVAVRHRSRQIPERRRCRGRGIRRPCAR